MELFLITEDVFLSFEALSLHKNFVLCRLSYAFCMVVEESQQYCMYSLQVLKQLSGLNMYFTLSAKGIVQKHCKWLVTKLRKNVFWEEFCCSFAQAS